MSNWKDTDEIVLKNMENWSERICERVFEHQIGAGIPPVVCVRAAMLFLKRWVPKCEVINEETALKMLEAHFKENEGDGIFERQTPMCSN